MLDQDARAAEKRSATRGMCAGSRREKRAMCAAALWVATGLAKALGILYNLYSRHFELIPLPVNIRYSQLGITA